MAKTKFTINKRTLVEEQADGYILTRVPNSNMDYYLLLKEDEVLSDDEQTLVAEWDSEQALNVLPRIYDGDKTRRPTLKEAIAESQRPEGVIQMKAEELYKDYYEYDEKKDPEQRELARQAREQKRQAALSRSDQVKGTIQKGNGQQGKSTMQSAAQERNASQNQQQQLSPAEEMARRRAQIQHYSKAQFREIRKGVRQRLDTSLYRNIDLSPKQMRELRLAMKAGLDVTKFNSPYISAKHMKELRIGAKRGVKMDLEKLDHSLYNEDQIHELRRGFEKKLTVKNYLNPEYSARQMRELRLGMQAGLDIAVFDDIRLTADQMHSVRKQMVLEHIGDILKRMCEDIREWLSEKMKRIAEHLMARYQQREPMTQEQIKEARINEAVQDIKDVLIQSELLPEAAYENEELDNRIKEQVENLVEYVQENPEQDLEQPAEEAAMDVCMAAGVEPDNLEEEKVVSIDQENEFVMAMEKAVEQAMQQAYEMDEVIEEETFEMIQ